MRHIFLIQELMSREGPIIIIEDDEDDRELFVHVVKELELKNEIKSFSETFSALSYLSDTDEKVFVIFCDINLPGQDGLQFKKHIDTDPKLRQKSIPFIFLSTSVNQKDVNAAYTQYTVQGFFKKLAGYNDYKNLLSAIFNYWKLCRHPNT